MESDRYRPIPRSSSAGQGLRAVPARSRDRESPFGLLPKRLQFLDRRTFDLFALRRQTPLHVSETLAEFGVGSAQRLLGIHLHETREIHQYKKKIAEFVLNLVLRPALAGF